VSLEENVVKSGIDAFNVRLKLDGFRGLALFYGVSKAGRAWKTKTNETDEMPLLPVVIIGALKVTSIKPHWPPQRLC